MNASNLVKLIGLSVIALGTTGCQTLSELSPFSSSFLSGLSSGLSSGLGLAQGKDPLTQAGDAVKVLSATSNPGGNYTAPTRIPMVTFASATPATTAPAKKQQQDCWRAIVHHPWAGGGLTEETFETKADAETAVAMGRRTYGGPASDVHLIGPCR